MIPDLILKNVKRHIELTDVETKLFLSLLSVRKLLKRQFLLKAGEICHTENFVASGLLRAYTTDNKGSEHVLMFAMEDWWVADLFSFLTGQPSSMNIEALEDSEVISIEKPALESLYKQVPKFERLMRILFQNAFVAQQQRILSGISQTTEERYSTFIKKYPTLEQRVPQTQIASYLGMTPETLSRIRKQWSQ
jgi:CRP-like cAMP-binding protein